MAKYSLASDTIDKDDYVNMVNFLKAKKNLTQANVVKKFESNFSEFLGKKFSVFVNSGSSANFLIAQSLLEGNYLKNKIVVLPSVSWSTTVSPYLQLGFKIIIADCDKNNLGICPIQLENLCKKYNPGLVVVVNVLGHANLFKQINILKKKYNFVLVEDNCESLGSYTKTKNLGTFGLASSHSFYYGHHISTIEGGMISTNDNKLFNISLAIRSHGWARDMQDNYKNKLEKKYKIDEFRALYTFYYSGLNIRSTDFNANIGIKQLNKIKSISNIRFKNYLRYKINLKNFWSQNSDLKLVSSFGYATFVKNRVEVFNYLKSKNIQSRPLICGNMAEQPFIKKKIYKSLQLKNAEFVNDYGIYLPNHANLSFKNVDYICHQFNKCATPITF